MRLFLYLFAIASLIGSASANRPVSGVVAVSTGPMQAKYTDANREIGRDLGAGDSVFLNDEIATGRRTKAQILLKDESVFSISPNSKVVVDEFMYDPFEQTGTLSAQLLGGGVRFVSGKIANRQPQNIKIKAGSATVGIRGTEIIAQHSDEGSTFVLLSGAMEVSTPAGLQTINRPGFGLDVSADGILGDIRRVPMEEINQLLSPPPSANDDSAADDDEGGEADSNDDGADANEETASDEGNSGSDDDGDTAAAEPASSAETGDTDGQDATGDAASTESAASAETETETKSSFDSALMTAAKSDSETEQTQMVGLSDMNLGGASEDAPSSEANVQETANDETQTDELAEGDANTAETQTSDQTAEEPVLQLALATQETIFSSEDVTALIVESLAEDEKEALGTIVAEEIATDTAVAEESATDTAISLTLESTGTLTANPFFSSNANLLVRSREFFKSEAPAQFNVTHALMREKFPDSFDDNGFINHAHPRPTDTELDLSSYDAILIYADWNDDSNFNEIERTAYRAFIHDDGKKVLTIGRQENDMGTANSILRIYSPDDATGTYQYSASADTRNPQTDYPLTPNGASTSALLAGVGDFPNHYDSNGFQVVEFAKTLDGVAQPFTGDDEFILANDDASDSFAALDLGSTGAVFLSRWSCGSNGDGGLGTSINANLVNNSREQFCRNLISSIAPDDTLVDVEVGTLSVSGNASDASYRLISGGTDNFKIIGDKLILDKGASLATDSYDLTIGVTPTGGEEIERTVSVSVADGTVEKRVIATRDTYNVGDTVSFPTENLVSHTDYLEDISWVTIGSNSGDGVPTNTGIITLHYRITEGGTTYDRFHEIEINHDCSSDYCKEFATSMDTEGDLVEGHDFEEGTMVGGVFDPNDFTSWSSFFDRFTTGTGRFVSRNYQETWPVSIDYHYDLEVNYGSRAGILEADGTFAGHTLDERWQFNFLQCSGASGSHICYFTDDNDNFDLSVNLANISLPNGKHSIMLRNTQHWNGTGSDFGWSLMTPQ